MSLVADNQENWVHQVEVLIKKNALRNIFLQKQRLGENFKMNTPKPFDKPIYVTRPALPDRKAVYRKIDEIWDSQQQTNIGHDGSGIHCAKSNKFGNTFSLNNKKVTFFDTVNYEFETDQKLL